MDVNKLFATLLMAASTSACAGGSLKPTVPDSGDARKACPVAEGTVIQVTDVTIEGNIEAAQAVGAGIGGYAGNRATKKENELVQIAATVAGAVVGSMAGDAAGKTALNKDGQELIVVINGKAHSIIQQTDGRASFVVGDDVWVIGDLSGRNRSANQNCRNGIRAIPKE